MKRRTPTGWLPLTAEELVGAVARAGLAAGRTPAERAEVRALLDRLGYDVVQYVRARYVLRRERAGLPTSGYVWDRPDLPMRRR